MVTNRVTISTLMCSLSSVCVRVMHVLMIVSAFMLMCALGACSHAPTLTVHAFPLQRCSDGLTLAPLCNVPLVQAQAHEGVNGDTP